MSERPIIRMARVQQLYDHRLRDLVQRTGDVTIATIISGSLEGMTPADFTTAGGLVFYGDNTGGALIAVDARTGQRLWAFDTQQTWKASPMTYAIDGKQHIGVVAGSTVRVSDYGTRVFGGWSILFAWVIVYCSRCAHSP